MHAMRAYVYDGYMKNCQTDMGWNSYACLEQALFSISAGVSFFVLSFKLYFEIFRVFFRIRYKEHISLLMKVALPKRLDFIQSFTSNEFYRGVFT